MSPVLHQSIVSQTLVRHMALQLVTIEFVGCTLGKIRTDRVLGKSKKEK